MTGSNLFTGTLDILVLKTVLSGRMHGYAIGRVIRNESEGVLSVEEGALYPALHRLQKRGLLDAEWGRTETGRRAKFYELTAEGRRHLAAETERWNAYSGAVAGILGQAG